MRAVVGLSVVLAGCAYHNTIYNAERLFDQAERARRSGDDRLADSLYLEVVGKTSTASDARPNSDWAPEAHYLAGRALFRLGEFAEAEEAFADARSGADEQLERAIRVYDAALLAERGREGEALVWVNDALQEGLEGGPLAEAHLLRGRWLMRLGILDHAWWDLDQAARVEPTVRVEAGLERLRWSIHHGDREGAAAAIDLLLSYQEGGSRLASFNALVGAAADRWGAREAAELLVGAAAARWSRESRGRVRLERARLLRRAGDPRAEAEAWDVAEGLGIAAAEARLLLAQWELEGTADLVDAYGVRGILLPAGADPEVAELVGAVDELELLTDIGLDDPLAWFAAAEVARDRLGAHYLARGLFLAYADAVPDEPWVPKALMAALDVSAAEGDRAWLRGRLEEHDLSPYVRAAHGRPSPGFEALEEELQVRLRELRTRGSR